MINDSIDNIRLDLNRPKVRASLSVRKGDTKTRTIHVALASNGAVFNLSNCAFAELIIKKPDGNICDQNMIIVDNELQYTFRTQDTNVVGECLCQIQLTFLDGSVVNTPEFFMYVYSTSIDSKVTESMNEYTAISQMAAEAVASAQNAKDSENNAGLFSTQSKAAADSAEESKKLASGYAEEANNVLSASNDIKGYVSDLAVDVTNKSNHVSQMAETVAISLEEVKAHKQEAIMAKGEASASQLAAELAASSASASASSAAQSKTYAKTYADNAYNSAEVATSRASQSAQSATSAGTSADVATLKASESLNSADQASASAKIATEKANAANSSAVAAAKSANSATEVLNSAKTSIDLYKNTAIEDIKAAHDEFLEQIPEDYSKIQNDVNELKTNTSVALTDLKNQVDNKLSTFNAEADNLQQIESCADGNIKNLKVYGNTTQKKYQGYNLLNLDKLQAITKNGITLSYDKENNLINVKGTPTITSGYISFTTEQIINVETNIELGAFIFQVTEKKAGIGISLPTAQEGALNLTMADTITAKIQSAITFKSTALTINVRYDVGKIDFSFKAQLENGNTFHEYEPFTNKLPSPSPDYPQEIKSVERIDLKVCGRNLFNPQWCPSNIYSGVTIEYNPSDDTFILNGTATNTPTQIRLVAGTNNEKAFNKTIRNKKIKLLYQYVSGSQTDISGENDTYIRVISQTNNTTQISGNQSNFIMYNFYNNDSKAIDINDNAFDLRLEIRAPKDHEFNNFKFRLMMITDDTDTYESYKGAELSIIPPRPLNAINNYKDYLDVESGLWRYVIAKTNNVITRDTTNTTGKYRFKFEANCIPSVSNNVIAEAYCTHEKAGKPNAASGTYGCFNGVSIDASGYVHLYDDKLSDYTIQSFRDFVSANNLWIYYPSKIEETEKADAEIISKLRQLKTYKGCTNLFVTDQNGDDITTWFLYAFDMVSWFNEVNSKTGIVTETVSQLQNVYESDDIDNAWAYINSVYAEALADFSE